MLAEFGLRSTKLEMSFTTSCPLRCEGETMSFFNLEKEQNCTYLH